MVCTKLTGLLSIAMLLAICPPTWKKARGAVVAITTLVGKRNPPLSPSTDRSLVAFARAESVTHHDDTNPNWISVSVTGCGNELSIVFEEVFDSAEERYLHT
jgi:hypothetical protein